MSRRLISRPEGPARLCIEAFGTMATAQRVNGEGHASKRIADVLLTGRIGREPFVASA
ncbi:MAG: hypothetical protein ABIR59_06420 [Gemmatimonadales bacterium]